MVSRIKPHIFPITQMREITYEEKWDKAALANVLASVNQLSHSSRLIEGMVAERKMKIMGAVLGLSTGKVNFLDV